MTADLIKSMEAFKYPEEEIEKAKADLAAASSIPVLTKNLDAVNLFLGLSMDSEIGPDGRRYFNAIPRESIKTTADLMGIEVTPAVFEKLRALEFLAIKKLNS